MNEGKPTKAKWWGRPRPQDPAAADEAQGPVTAPAGSADTEGDFELARPEARRDEHAGDYELRRPDAPAQDGPGAASAGSVVSAGSAVSAASAVESPEAASTGAETGGGAPAVPTVPPAVPTVPPAVPAVPAQDAPKPLHDPDPYSTPPYGEPGPWAPAPPVQHPAATPAHGVATPSPAMPGTPGAPAAHGTSMTPPSGVPAPGALPGPGVPAPAVPASAVPAPEVPASAVAAPGTPGSALRAADVPAADAPASAVPSSVPYVPSPSGPAPIPAQASQPRGIPEPAPAPGPDPWRRYDPWAAPGPLQQTRAPIPGTEQRRRRGRKTLVLGAVVLALVSGGIGGLVGTYLERNGGVGTVELPQAGKEAAGRDADSVAGIAGRALPSVVTLHVSGSGEQGTGTGFVLDTRGHILTNNHVVRPAGTSGEITVTFNGGETAKAELVGRDSGYDLAVVKVKGVSGLTPLPLGNSDNVQVGDPVVAIGAPFDLAGTVTSGIISAKQRPITAGGEKGDGSDVSYVDALQTDAPINPGNSGGPLLDSKARVIGINSAIRSADSGSDLDSGQSGSIGLGFAIPINQGKRVAEELINTGKATHPVIGITLDMDYTGDGARVGTEGSEGGPPVTAGGPGARAGIKAGDVITEVDGRRIHSGEELIVKTRAHRPGDRLELTVERGGRERTVSLVLGSSGG
ncbi:trypsin-like peptidase domain-containing protein [Streptomyces sp. NPDC094143]|uniref:S1C family serine protease n=1 Tax=Streptomyces sp. NPDC094143 TaxID=3155310 RepID=UPI00331C0BA9